MTYLFGTTGGGQTLYEAVVATSGGDYTTLGDAITAGKTRIFVRNGTYTESVISTATTNLYIRGESEAAVLSFTTNSCTFSGADGRFENLTFSHTTAGVLTFSGARTNITGCVISGTATTTNQLVISGAHSVIQNCKLGPWGNGAADKITLSGDRIQMRNCYITHGNMGNVATKGLIAITTNRVSIEGCDLDISASASDAIIRTNGADQIIISNNTVLCGGTGQFIVTTLGTADSVISGNHINSCITFFLCNGAQNCNFNNITGNTILGNSSTSFAFLKLGSTGVFNNTIVNANTTDNGAAVTKLFDLGGSRNTISNNSHYSGVPAITVNMAVGSDNNLILGNQFNGGTASNAGAGNILANNN